MPSFSFLSLYALTDVQYHHYDANLHFHLLNYSKHTQITSSTSQSKPLFSLLSAASKHACIEQNLLNLSSELQAMFSGQMHYAMGVAQQAAHRCCVGVIVGVIALSPTPLLVFPKDVFSKDGISVTRRFFSAPIPRLRTVVVEVLGWVQRRSDVCRAGCPSQRTSRL